MPPKARSTSRGAAAKAAPKPAAKPAVARPNSRTPSAKLAAKPVAKAGPRPEDEVKRKAEEDAQLAAAAAEESEAEEMRKVDTEAQAKAQAEASAAAAAAEAERERKAALANGNVVLKYSMYNEKFPIRDHKLLASDIDEVYCLSDVMPGCVIHLSTKSSEEKYEIETKGGEFSYIFEEPAGTFHDLMAGSSYFVYVTEDEAEFSKSQENAKRSQGHPCRVEHSVAVMGSVELCWLND